MSLFGDDDSGEPWSLPGPKLGNGDRRIASLLSGATIPESYNAAFETTHPIAGYATKSALKTFLQQKSGIDASQQERILEVVGSGNGISKDVWNVAMALVALAQGGNEEELDLDAVDFVRDSLPELRSSDQLHSAAVRATSPGTSPMPESWTVGGNIIDPISSASPVAAAAGAAGAAPIVESEEWSSSTDPLHYNPVSKDTVHIKIVPEREGMFLFRHVVYVIEGTYEKEPGIMAAKFKVVRRYSDFLWLLECLVKMYPFRLLPVLPPKRLTVDGRYLSSDAYFLERRRRGLTRFLNQLVKHPRLKKEKLTQMFLTVDTELAVWRKQSSLHVEEEFVNRVAPPSFIASFDDKKHFKRWTDIRQAADDVLEILANIVPLIDRACKRQEAMASDFSKISNAFASLKSPLTALYTKDDGDNSIAGICEGVLSVSRYTSNAQQLLKDESQAMDIGVLEDTKQLRELINSIKELFSRHEKFGGNSITFLQQRITASEKKLEQLNRRLNQDPPPKPQELEKLRTQISQDKRSIQQQTNRDWLIKECLVEEVELAQRTQFQVTKLVREWAGELVKYSELIKDNWTEVNADVEHMPLS